MQMGKQATKATIQEENPMSTIAFNSAAFRDTRATSRAPVRPSLLARRPDMIEQTTRLFAEHALLAAAATAGSATLRAGLATLPVALMSWVFLTV